MTNGDSLRLDWGLVCVPCSTPRSTSDLRGHTRSWKAKPLHGTTQKAGAVTRQQHLVFTVNLTERCTVRHTHTRSTSHKSQSASNQRLSFSKWTTRWKTYSSAHWSRARPIHYRRCSWSSATIRAVGAVPRGPWSLYLGAGPAIYPASCLTFCHTQDRRGVRDVSPFTHRLSLSSSSASASSSSSFFSREYPET